MASFRAALQGAIGDTEKEILDFAFDRDTPDRNRISHDDGDELIEYGSQVEGSDGMPLGDEEIAAAAMQGEVPGYLGDRPLQYEHELSVDRENAALKAQMAQKDAEVAQWRQRYDPEVRAQAELERANFMDQHGLVAVDEQKANALFGQLAQVHEHNQQRFADDVRASADRAREEYGEQAFNQAGKSFEQLPQNHQRSVEQMVLSSPNPGRTFLELMNDSALVDSLKYEPPFARRRDPDSRPTRWPSQNEDQENLNSGYGDSATEKMIWDSWK